jgi:ABC-2 type transport system permease protein
MTQVIAFTMLETALYTRNPVKLISLIGIPVILLVLMGGIYGNVPDASGFGMIDRSLTGYIGMAVAFAGLMSLPLTLCQYRERKILKRFRATPANPASILASQLIVNLFITLAGVLLLLVVGKIVYHVRFPGNWGFLVLAFLLCSAAVFALGFLIASLVRDTKTANAVSFVLYFPMLMLSGATIPVNAMPSAMANVSKALPLTYGIDLMKLAWTGAPVAKGFSDLVVLAGVFLGCSAISALTFRWE